MRRWEWEAKEQERRMLLELYKDEGVGPELLFLKNGPEMPKEEITEDTERPPLRFRPRLVME